MITKYKAFLLLALSLPTKLRGYEVTTPWGAMPSAWAVCQPEGAAHYIWTRGDKVVTGVDSNWYLLQEADDGQNLSCGVASDMGPPVLIGDPAGRPQPVQAPAPMPDPTPQLIRTSLTLQDGVIADTPWGSFPDKWAICNVDPSQHEPMSFSWARDGQTIVGASCVGYLISQDDDGSHVNCQVQTSSGLITSAPVKIGNGRPPAPTPAPAVQIGNGPAPEPTPPPANDPTPAPVTDLTTPVPAPAPSPQNKALIDIIDFAPWLAGDEPFSILPDSVVHDRVDLVAPYANGLRTFACYNGAESIRYAKSLGMTTFAGAWIDFRGGQSNDELSCLVALAKEGVVDLAIVGSEVLTWNGLNAQETVDYIERFRAEVPNVPVTTAVKYEAVIDAKNAAVISAVDILYVNFYPFWTGHHIDAALGVLKEEYAIAKALASGKAVWISETGWPSAGSCANGQAEPSAENQERYLREVIEWTATEGIVLSWFDGFEQIWKGGSEWCDVASHWGLFDGSSGQIKPGPARVLA